MVGRRREVVVHYRVPSRRRDALVKFISLPRDLYNIKSTWAFFTMEYYVLKNKFKLTFALQQII